MFLSTTPRIRPGSFELYTGCMFSGKSRELINRLDLLSHLPNVKITSIKPMIDTRTEKITSRFGSYSLDCIKVDERRPETILERIYWNETQIVAFDEINLFYEGITGVVESLMKKGTHVLGAGLDTDFRGESFGSMERLLVLATDVVKLKGVCMVNGCDKEATRTQRMINGKPAPYDSPLIQIEGEATYECRCLLHHEVPGRPKRYS